MSDGGGEQVPFVTTLLRQCSPILISLDRLGYLRPYSYCFEKLAIGCSCSVSINWAIDSYSERPSVSLAARAGLRWLSDYSICEYPSHNSGLDAVKNNEGSKITVEPAARGVCEIYG
ncbi:hypothetical protein J6590_010082 [Homalodisca vitripennis]|nr:hypothetical protein J6590_010082 [Homalodisca vitripennis]